MSQISSSVKQAQQDVLRGLLKAAHSTRFGNNHGFKGIYDYKQYKKQVPVQSYRDIEPQIQQLKEGQENIFWPGKAQQFAVSSGTSGEGKHLPLSPERLQSDKRFMRKVAISYLRQRPQIFKLMGAHLSMPGTVEQHGNLQMGEISGFTALHSPSWLRIFQVADPRKLTKLSFQQKFDFVLDKALKTNLKVIIAVPSWILTLFQRALKRTGKASVAEIWPNLQLLVCGGVKLANYRPHLEMLAKGLSPDFIETYGASEGYIGFSDDLKRDDLKMVTDNGLFFECIPDPVPATNASSIKKTIPLWEVKEGVSYGLVLSTNAGLWRYTINDIIEFTSLDPLRFTVKGRVNDMLDDFGEALYIREAKEALKRTTKRLKVNVGTFAISPILRSSAEVPYHRWFVQFFEQPRPWMLQEIATRTDKCLQEINRHYAIRRESNAMDAPEIFSVNQSQINTWLQSHGKANAQGKLPKILPHNSNLCT